MTKEDVVDQPGKQTQIAMEQTDALRLKEEEEKARRKAKRNPLFLFLMNSVSTILIFIFHLISVS
jgi:hypothetical protein